MKYEPINGWTKERILEYVKTNFKGKSIEDTSNDYPRCLYRGPDGTKCAVGIFMPDDLYRSDMEGCGISAVLSDYPDLKNNLPLGLDALYNLQKVHDESSPENCLLNILKYIEKNVK